MATRAPNDVNGDSPHGSPNERDRPHGSRGPGRSRAARTLDAGTSDPHVLRDYSFLADGYRGAVIGPHGNVAWLCAPRWDSEPVFAGLVGGSGSYVVIPAEPHVWGGYYEPGSLIWRARWTTTSTRVECREALAAPSDPHCLVLLRRVEAVERAVEFEIGLQPAEGFSTRAMDLTRDESGAWLARSGDLRVRWTGAPHARADRAGVVRQRVRLEPGQRLDLVLEVSERALPAEPPVPDSLWSRTEEYWRTHVPDLPDVSGRRDARLSYAVLRGLTAPGGGMVAAATLGLPESDGAGRNYDYRYVWLRDQAYAGVAAGAGGPDSLTDEAVAFTTARVLEHGSRLAPAYRLDGRLPPGEKAIDLPGYPGGRVILGNRARGQFQLDVHGELLQLYATAGRHDHLDSDDVRAVQVLIGRIEEVWQRPDAGIWELDDAWWTHSRLTCVAGLRAIAAQLAAPDASRCSTLADAILAETSRKCLNPDGSWRQAPDRPGVDAALLLPPVRGALPVDDPRSVATLQAVLRDLVSEGYVYRYAVDGRPLGDVEGAFLMCGFLLTLAQLAAGDVVDAFRWFERQRSACGPPGLFTEEFHVQQRQLRGNLPQGFVHALMLEAAIRLGECEYGRGAG